jgi:hypothetical protein
MSENRRHPRISWVVEAKLHCRTEDVHWDVRLTDISVGGCFVDTVVPLDAGSPVVLKLRDEAGAMDIPGKILYGQPYIGSAIAFDDLDGALRQRLEQAIAGAGG